MQKVFYKCWRMCELLPKLSTLCYSSNDFFSLFVIIQHKIKFSTCLPPAGFLFLYHLHGRDMLDVHVHTLLLYAIFGQAFICLLEVFHRGNILLELLRATLTILQGSWFWQVSVCMHI